MDEVTRQSPRVVSDESSLISADAPHSFARLALILAYRERQRNPTPGGNATGAGAGGASTSGITSIRLNAPQHGASGPSTAAPSPASTAAARVPKQKRAMSIAADSDTGTPGPSGYGMGAQQPSKKAKKLAAQQLAEQNDPTLPLDPIEREKELDKRRKAALTRKRADAKIRKERKAAQQAAQMQANDLQVGTPNSGSLKIALPTMGAQARY